MIEIIMSVNEAKEDLHENTDACSETTRTYNMTGIYGLAWPDLIFIIM